jgi:ferrochelatase
MLNMGGPETPELCEPFLRRLFQDNDIIEFGGGMVQNYLGNFIASRRAPKVAKQYERK